MKYNSLTIGLSVLALQSCTDNLISIDSDNEAILTGNTYEAAFTENASTEKFLSLNSGSKILLNASGSLQINNKILTYIGYQWKAENEFDWTDRLGKTSITALYPVYSDAAYTQNNLYRNHTLEDILYVKDEFPAGKNIHLQFKHLFSLLTLHLSEELQNNFQKIEVTFPTTVFNIAPQSAEITFAPNEPQTLSITQVSPSGNYSFIVPPVESVTIPIDILTNGKKYTTQLEPKSFISNHEYTYHLKISEKTPGIVTTEDWIAFSQLINHKNTTEYNGKTLDDFGEMLDGIMTYRLLNDINFAEVDCTDLESIGYAKTNFYFSDIFDGQGHTLSNMPLKPSQGTTGVFGVVSETGTVKNLHINSCNVAITQKSNSTKEGTSILVGRNGGKILNCSVEDCQIKVHVTKTTQSANTGGVAGTSTGLIINCYVKNIDIEVDYLKDSKIEVKPAGGIVGSSQGLILNCYSTNNTIKNRGSHNGGICGSASQAHIENCYVYSLDQIATKGLLAGKAENSFFIHNYYNTAVPLIGTDSKNQKSGNVPYTNTFTDQTDIPVYQLLNQWIDETAPSLYPDYTFTRWTDGGERLPAIFVSEVQ